MYTVHGTQDFHPWKEFRTGFGDLSIRRDTPEFYYRWIPPKHRTHARQTTAGHTQ